MIRMLKQLLPKGRAPRTVRGGLYRGLRLELDLQSELLIYLGLYEAELTPHIRRLARGCRSGVDLGAAGGELTLWLLRQPEIERIVAVEPLAREQERFERALALNGFAGDPRVVLHRGFAGAGPTPEFQPLSRLIAGLPEPLFVKIDIDGPEADVLADARADLSARDCRLVIETHSPEAERGCEALLSSAGYRVQIINPAWWRKLLPERRVIPHNRWLIAARAAIS